ncbi:MAG: 4Fe-4S binding protein [Pseudomonadota bacterium]
MTDQPRLMLCDCTGTFKPDARAIELGTGLSCEKIHTHLCGPEAGAAAEALKGGDTIIACGQMLTAFTELAEDLDVPSPLLIDIRDRGGWSDDVSGPKQAALLADALLPAPPVPVMDVTSEGVCLVIGEGELALAAGARLATAMTVTVMLTDGAVDLLPQAEMDIVTGRVKSTNGSLGQFSVKIDRFAQLKPAGRGPRAFEAPRDGATSACDVIVDLTGGTPLFPAPNKRDGYLRADPGNSLAVEQAIFDASQLVGTFEKSLFIRFEASLCAHSRAEQTGCTRCLDLCPTSAISPAGEHVAIDPNICAGCGACAAVCPSGAATAEDPTVQHLFRRMRTLSDTFQNAGGTAPRLLVHDDHGAEMIRLAARHGRGLPGNVIPMEVTSLNAFGHAEQVTALAVGFQEVLILAGPHTEQDPLAAQIALADTLGADGRAALIDVTDPEALSDRLYGTAPELREITPILPLGGRREAARLAAKALNPEAETLSLPSGAPYGAVVVDTDACTLCLSCAGLCPTGALGDNPNAPELNFREEACLQCGLCQGLCPEQAITLVPQMNLTEEALRPRVLNEEEPFACIECGVLFGVKSTIDAVVAKLESHPMFVNSDNARLIQMCDDCRVKAQYHTDAAPFQGGQRPKVRTTQDYIDERQD